MSDPVLHGFLFDLDGTLIHTAPDLCGTIHDMQASRGHALTPMKDMEHLSSGGARALLGIGFGIRPEDADFQVLRQEFLDRYEGRIAKASHCYDGIETLLDNIERQGKAWAVVTNKPFYLAKQLMDKLGLLERCSALVGGDTTEKPKPSALPCLHAAELLNIPNNHCIMIGDDERDIVAGRNAKMATAAVRYGYIASDLSTWGADYVFDTPGCMAKLLDT